MSPANRGPWLPDVLLELDRLARELGEAGIQREIQGLAQRVAQARVRVVVLGPAGAGKSSLINALAGRPVLPEGRLRTTGRVVSVTIGGPADEFEAIRADGAPAPLTEARFQNACLGAGRWIDVRAALRTATPFSAPIALVDTPAEWIAPEAESADGLILMLDHRSLTLPETELWLGRTVAVKKPLLFVLNFCPAGRPDAQAALLERRLTEPLGPAVRLHRVPEREKSRLLAVDAVRGALQELLNTHQRARLTEQSLVWEAMQSWRRLEQSLAAEARAAKAAAETAAVAEGRNRQLESLRDQALGAVKSWRKHVDEQLSKQVAAGPTTDLDALGTALNLMLSLEGAALRRSLRGALDQALALVPAAVIPPMPGPTALRLKSAPFTDTRPERREYLVNLPKDAGDQAWLRNDLLSRYRTAIGDFAAELQELIRHTFSSLQTAQAGECNRLSARAVALAGRVGALGAALQVAEDAIKEGRDPA